MPCQSPRQEIFNFNANLMISENSCSSFRINWQNWHKTVKLAKTATFQPRASSYFSASMLSSWLSFFFGLSEVLAQVNRIDYCEIKWFHVIFWPFMLQRSPMIPWKMKTNPWQRDKPKWLSNWRKRLVFVSGKAKWTTITTLCKIWSIFAQMMGWRRRKRGRV